MILRDFQEDASLRASFNALAQAVFGIDFEEWYQNGYWDEAYVCRAWVEEGQVLATVGASPMDLQLGGVRFQALQIGTVMTHPAHRGRGLSSRLLEATLASGEPAFLFADAEAERFYPRFGFRRVRQCDFALEPGPAPGPVLPGRSLKAEQAGDRALLHRLASRRAPVSRRLAVRAPNLVLWWALNPLRGSFVHVPEMDLVWAGRRKDAVFHLHDVIAARMPCWEELRRCLPLEGVDRVVFHFTPDLVAPQAEAWPAEEDDLFYVRGDWALGAEPFRYPLTGQA
jgi:GNAT superfamily N-acetyltransferase